MTDEEIADEEIAADEISEFIESIVDPLWGGILTPIDANELERFLRWVTCDDLLKLAELKKKHGHE